MSKLVKVALIQVGAIVVLIIGTEALLWTLLPVSLQGFEVKEKYSQSIPGLKKNIVYEKNRFGLRSTSMKTLEKPANTIRILCLGASTTDQATQNTEDTWCSLLESALSRQFAQYGVAFESMGYGRGGFRAISDARWLASNLGKLSPDIVITLLGINDLAFNGGKGYSYGGLQNAFNVKSDFQAVCRSYSQLCRRFFILRNDLKIKRKLKTGEVVEWHSRKLPALRKEYKSLPYVASPERNPDPIHEFAEVVNWSAAYLQDNDIQTIILGQPVLWHSGISDDQRDRLWFKINTPSGPVRPSMEWLAREMDKYNAIQTKAAKEYGAAFVDLNSKIPKTLEYYFDDCHFTDKGSRSVAEHILPALKPVIEKMVETAR